MEVSRSRVIDGVARHPGIHCQLGSALDSAQNVPTGSVVRVGDGRTRPGGPAAGGGCLQ